VDLSAFLRSRFGACVRLDEETPGHSSIRRFWRPIEKLGLLLAEVNRQLQAGSVPATAMNMSEFCLRRRETPREDARRHAKRSSK